MALDGLRAVAVGLVVIHHALQPYLFGGFIGVDIFFVLSGFLITSIIRREMATGRFSLPRFYWNRAVRLYPALLAAVIVCTPLGMLVNSERTAGSQAGDAALGLAYVMNIVEHSSGDLRWLWSHTWSLATEEQFYLAWPLALLGLTWLRIGRRQLIAILVSAMAASAAWHAFSFNPSVPDFSPVTRAQGLLAGCLVAVFLENRSTVSRCAAAFTPLLVSGVALLGLALAWGTAVHTWHPIPIATFGAGLVIAALASASAGSHLVVRALSWGPAVYIGAISYGIYLWHFPLELMGRMLPGGPYLWVALSVPVSVGVAALSHRYIEVPAMGLRTRS